MRVISGTYGGRLLTTPSRNADFRPTTDRVRESLFNILEHTYGLEGKTVCDLFAGTGSLGIEALSRDAASAVFVEQSRNHAAVLADNLKMLGITESAIIEITSVEQYLARTPRTFDIIFCDPPYGYPKAEVFLSAIASRGVLASGGIMVFEHSGKTALAPPSPWKKKQTRSYGTTAITILELES